MGMGRQVSQFARRRVTRRLTRTVPFIGGVLALVTLGGAIKRKGWFGGALDMALDFTPVVGTLKNLAEVSRGRDFITDRPRPQIRPG
jgi:hypothetical protein